MAGSSFVVAETAAAKEVAAMVTTKERVPESYITRIKARPLRKMAPLSDDDDDIFADDPSCRETIQAGIDHINYLVDMEQDCLRQHAEKGYAEIGVDFTSGGVKKVFILPQPQPQPQTQTQVMMTQKGNGGGGRSKEVFVIGFATVFALLVVLLSFSLMSGVSVQV